MSSYEELRRQIARNFDRDEVAMILSDALNIDLAQKVPDGDFDRQLFELQKKGVQEGWYEKFITELAKRRPNKADFQQAASAALADLRAPAPVAMPENPSLGPSAQQQSISNLLRALFQRIATLRIARLTAMTALATGAAVWLIFGWVPLPIEVWIESDPGTSIREGRNVAVDGSQPTYKRVSHGYSVKYNGLAYGTNPSGETRLIVAPLLYAGTWLLNSALPGSVLCEGGESSEVPLKVRSPRIDLRRTFCTPGPASGTAGGGMGAREDATVQTTAAGSWNLIGELHAAPAKGGRLYIQSVSVPAKVSAETVTAKLTIEKRTVPLSEIGANLTVLPSEGQLQVRANASIVQNYQFFFELPQPHMTGKAVIKLESPNWFGGGYSDSFTVPENLKLGQPTVLESDTKSGAKLVVQLSNPIDVVFFERLRTPPATRKLVPLVGSAGFATRLNTRGTDSGGSYNVVYSGEDVPTETLQSLLKVITDGGVKLKYVQAGIKLSSRVQNQIQVGSNDAVACLDDLSPDQIAKLTGSVADFDMTVKQLPKPKPTDDCVKDD